MKKAIDVLTLGDLCVDLILFGSDITPEFGQKEKLIDDYSLEMGGSCSIFACQAAKLGLHTALIGSVGDDAFGELIRDTLVDAGVDGKYIKTDSSVKTGISTALSKSDDRAILTYNGTINAVMRSDISDEIIPLVRHLHIGSFYLMTQLQPDYPDIIKEFKRHGATVSLDTNWDPEEKWDGGIWDILPYIDVFLPNENEAMAFAGENNVEAAIKKLSEQVPVLVVKTGKSGAVAFSGGEIYRAGSLPVAVVDTIGAGDSFDAGFIYGYLSGKTIEECLEIGCICGSLSTRKSGGEKGQPRLNEVENYLHR
jgi:sugar/nucleoside kinase (ribokinase family)